MKPLNIQATIKPKFLLTHGQYGMQFFNGGMTPEERELRQAYKNAYDNAQDAIKNKLSKEERATAMQDAKDALEALNQHLELAGMTPVAPTNLFTGNDPAPTAPAVKAENKDKLYKEAFFNMLRGRKLTEEQASVIGDFKAAMTEGVDIDGGYIVPEDITTTINELKQTTDSLEQYVNVQPVQTNKGARTLEVRASSTPLVKLSEMGTIQETDQPKFQRVGYAIEDFAGFMKVSKDLLADTDQGLTQYLARWFAKKSVATRNSLILAQINTLTKVDLKDFNGIKKTLNVTLDPAHASGAKIFTNQDGIQYLDTLMDGNGRPLLQPDPTSPTSHTLFGHSVVVLSNKTLATVAGKAPFIIGDLAEAVILWDRKQMSLDMTDIGGEAWRTNSMELRAIEREDVTLWDSEAVVFGQITLPA